MFIFLGVCVCNSFFAEILLCTYFFLTDFACWYYICSVTLHYSCLYVICKLYIQNMNNFFFQGFVFNREENFDTFVKISRHPVSTSHIYFFKAVIVKVENSAVFKEITYNRADGDIVTYAFYSCFETAYSADDKVNLNSGSRSFIQ